MTSTTDRARHPDVAEISDLTEGLLSSSRAGEVREHLSLCEQCADVRASLEGVRGLLGALPDVPPMPADVARRIDAALAAEVPLQVGTANHGADSADADDAAPAAPPVSGTGLSGHGDRVDVSRETAEPGRPAGHARAATGPGRKDRKRHGGRRRALLGTALGAAVLGLGSVLVSSLTGGGGSGTVAEGRPSTAADTFSSDTLQQQVTALLATESKPTKDSRSPHSFGIQGEVDSASPKVLQGSVLPECVRRGLGSQDGPALATENGTYQGKDALLVVLPDGTDSSRVTAYIMDATCIKNPSSPTASVLWKDSYPRP
ncbi:anti-sigma factor family protein [Streptomyces sp. MS06]|uniref:anti-sigma factor family protein n=1 Tax=Streptomyces sp. MS06 TaxID=3385974 RepID=UPI00399F425B